MSNQISTQITESKTNQVIDEIDKLDDTEPDGLKASVSQFMPEDTPEMMAKELYGYHKIDAGMVEVSLALAALVFTVAAISSDNLTDRPRVLGAFLILVFLTNMTALWFLTIYCAQQNVIKADPIRVWKNPFMIFSLLTKPKTARVYFWLALSLVFLVLMFLFVIMNELIDSLKV
jgi:hypothetical protein